jgi:hypothetical protein
MSKEKKDNKPTLDAVGSLTLVRGWDLDLFRPVFDDSGQPLLSENLPDTLWHYTDGGGVLGVVKSQRLWATHAFFMNDASELKLARTRLEECMESPWFSERLSDAEAQEIFKKAVNARLDRFDEDPRIYAVCFSPDGDDLGQWRAYGGAGLGYALGFETSDLARLAGGQFAQQLFPVQYDKDVQQATARGMTDASLVTIAEFPQTDRSQWLAAVERSASALGILAQWFAYRIKHPAFSAEREWRLLYQSPSVPPDPEDIALAEDLPRHFRLSTRGPIPYVEIPITKSDDLGVRGMPLSHVRIGPTAHPENEPARGAVPACRRGNRCAGESLGHPAARVGRGDDTAARRQPS